VSHMNDTHPVLSAPELMRILLDEHGLEWNRAFEITRQISRYTNHTLLPESLEKWDVQLMQHLLPRHLGIIRHFQTELKTSIETSLPKTDQEAAVRSTAILNLEPQQRESPYSKKMEDAGYVNMGNLAAYAVSRINGVSAMHSNLVAERLFPVFA